MTFQVFHISRPLSSAHDILAIPTTTTVSETSFSTGGRVLNEFRSALSPPIVLICAQDWIRSQPAPIHVDEKLAELEDLEISK